jgi:hypothetical protein
MSRDGLEPSTLGLKGKTVKTPGLAVQEGKSETPAHAPELVHEMPVVAPDLFQVVYFTCASKRRLEAQGAQGSSHP